MTVLADSEIRRLIQTEGLIEGGDESRVGPCAYECGPGTVLKTGEVAEPRAYEWDHARAVVEPFTIRPADMVWMRTSEVFHVPEDLCAFWWQTNSLSRRGLMLVNMSMVEPGYSGPLACLFANFGRRPVRVWPDTAVAKLVFVRLSDTSNNPYRDGKSKSEYDRNLVEDAADAPPSFLKITEFREGLRFAEQAARDRIKHVAEQRMDEAAAEIEKERRVQQAELTKDVRRSLLGALWPIAVLLVLFVAVVRFVPEVRGLFVPLEREEIRSVVREELDEAGVARINDRVEQPGGSEGTDGQ